jgi:hypothetical protein
MATLEMAVILTPFLYEPVGQIGTMQTINTWKKGRSPSIVMEMCIDIDDVLPRARFCLSFQLPKSTVHRAIVLQSRSNSPAMQETITQSYNKTANRTTCQLKQTFAETPAVNHQAGVAENVCPSQHNPGDPAFLPEMVWSSTN